MVCKCGPAQPCLSSQALGSICKTDPECHPDCDDPARPALSMVLLNHLQPPIGSPKPSDNPDFQRTVGFGPVVPKPLWRSSILYITKGLQSGFPLPLRSFSSLKIPLNLKIFNLTLGLHIKYKRDRFTSLASTNKFKITLSFPVKKYSQVLLPALVPEPVKVNPLGLAGGEEESLFQKELSEGSWEFLNKKKRGIND